LTTEWLVDSAAVRTRLMPFGTGAGGGREQ